MKSRWADRMLDSYTPGRVGGGGHGHMRPSFGATGTRRFKVLIQPMMLIPTPTTSAKPPPVILWLVGKKILVEYSPNVLEARAYTRWQSISSRDRLDVAPLYLIESLSAGCRPEPHDCFGVCKVPDTYCDASMLLPLYRSRKDRSDAARSYE